MIKNEGTLFWGFLDDQGELHLKRYTNDRQIANYERLPFVRGIFDPFLAKSVEQAKMLLRECYMKEIKLFKGKH